MMRVINNPKPTEWETLCMRPLFNDEQLTQMVLDIFEQVKQRGDEALIEYSKRFDGVDLTDNIKVKEEEFEKADDVDEQTQQAIRTAIRNVSVFHSAQLEKTNKIETQEGVLCWRKSVPIQKVGLYVPGGTAPLYSSLIMLGVPATIAGCNEIYVCTPPNADGNVSPIFLFICKELGIRNVFKVGGAQSIAAMTFGTKIVSSVFKVFGPGNQYVSKAKELAVNYGVSLDLPAGPSEVLVMADETCCPEFVAADLLSQAEHGVDSQVVLLTCHQKVVDAVLEQIALQTQSLKRREIIEKCLLNSMAIVFEEEQKMTNFSNAYAPEHLILASENPDRWLDGVENAGSVFIGNWSCESLGDYASGTNHTLPTNRFARNFSGVSLDSFMKKITFQEVSRTGIQNLGKTVETLADLEGLDAHKNAVTLRLNKKI